MPSAKVPVFPPGSFLRNGNDTKYPPEWIAEASQLPKFPRFWLLIAAAGHDLGHLGRKVILELRHWSFPSSFVELCRDVFFIWSRHVMFWHPESCTGLEMQMVFCLNVFEGLRGFTVVQIDLTSMWSIFAGFRIATWRYPLVRQSENGNVSPRVHQIFS